MCFMMGAAAGGMLPVTYALLAEMMPSKHRGWSLVLVCVRRLRGSLRVGLGRGRGRGGALRQDGAGVFGSGET